MTQKTAQLPRALSTIRREDIVEAARQTVLGHGFEQVTIEEIAARAGLSPGLIYYYFRNKEDLVITALLAVESELQRGLEARLHDCDSALAKLNAWVEYLLPSEANRTMWQFWLEIGNAATRHKKIRDLCKKTYGQWRRIREGILTQGVESGEFPPVDIRITAELLGALMEGLASRSIIQGYISIDEIRGVMEGVVSSLKSGDFRGLERWQKTVKYRNPAESARSQNRSLSSRGGKR